MPASLGLLAAAIPFARASHGHSTNHAIQPHLPEARAVRSRVYAENVTVRIEHHAQSARAHGRLRSSRNVLNLASADEPLPQSAGSELQDNVPIVFAVLTGKEHHDDRAAAAKQTWCAGINACIFFSDAPSATLPTIAISFDGLPSLTEYERAQLRYLPVLDYMRELMTSDMKFGKTKWLVMVDDDTFVFHRNLASNLALTDSSTPIYTGDVIPEAWLPVDRDGSGNELGVSSNTLFVNGGGGSVFSRAAVEQMNTEACVNRSFPGNDWWRWQSDWMIGACAFDVGIVPLQQPHGRYNQFACTAENVQFCDNTEVAEYEWPATLHPVRRFAQMKHLDAFYANSSSRGVPIVRIRRLQRQGQDSNGNDGLRMDSLFSKSGLELS